MKLVFISFTILLHGATAVFADEARWATAIELFENTCFPKIGSTEDIKIQADSANWKAADKRDHPLLERVFNFHATPRTASLAGEEIVFSRNSLTPLKQTKNGVDYYALTGISFANGEPNFVVCDVYDFEMKSIGDENLFLDKFIGMQGFLNYGKSHHSIFYRFYENAKSQNATSANGPLIRPKEDIGIAGLHLSAAGLL